MAIQREKEWAINKPKEEEEEEEEAPAAEGGAAAEGGEESEWNHSSVACERT